MSVSSKSRAIVAMAAAYALAVQATLLAASAALAGAADLAAGSAALSLCAPQGNGANQHPAAPQHGIDCQAACLACCCGAPIVPAAALIAAPRATATMGVTAIALAPIVRIRSNRAHRSRAPPLG